MHSVRDAIKSESSRIRKEETLKCEKRDGERMKNAKNQQQRSEQKKKKKKHKIVEERFILTLLRPLPTPTNSEVIRCMSNDDSASRFDSSASSSSKHHQQPIILDFCDITSISSKIKQELNLLQFAD